MNKRLVATLSFLSIMTLWMFSCEKMENDKNISSHSEDESHNAGQNCMNCHYQVGPGEGWFSLAGSVYGNYQDHSVRVYDALNQDLLAIVEVDQLGNFYTTESIDFSNGTTIDIIDEQGQVIAAMGTVVKTGQCNLCHDDSFQAKIVIQ